MSPQDLEKENTNVGKPGNTTTISHTVENPSKNVNNNNDSKSLAVTFGSALASFSDVINENLIAARYGTIATVTLLTAFGLSRTPIFFRYKRVSDIPSDYFSRRRTIYGRVVHVVENDIINTYTKNNQEDKPVICLVRHSSPFGRLLNRSSFEYLMRRSPSSLLKKNARLEDAKDLLKVEIAGIKMTPQYGMEDTNVWLQRLAANRTPVSCTLLSRRIIESTLSKSKDQGRNGRILNKMNDQPFHNDVIDKELGQAAICHVKYRPSKAIFRQDLGSYLVRNGIAALSSGIHIDIPSMTTIDGSTKIGDLENDVKYLDSLATDEYMAFKEKKGIWLNEVTRSHRPDLVDEAEFEMNAGVLKKIWRKITQR